MSEKEKLSDFAYKTLKQMILTNTFKPGEHLEEVSLSEMLKISRTPLREATNRLIYEDLLVSVPQKGIFVPDLSIQKTAELFRARKMIEPMVILLSAARLDKDTLLYFRRRTLELVDSKSSNTADVASQLHTLDYEFHDYINRNCGNQYILRTVTYTSDHFQRVRTQDFFPLERAINGAREHLTIIDAIIQGDLDSLPSLMLEHITSTEKYYYKKLLSNDVVEKNIDYIKNNIDSICR